MLFTVERRVGRLVEARVFRLMTPADADQYASAFPRHIVAGQAILVADHRPVVIYPQEVVDKLIETFRALNRYWGRVAILIASSNATLSLQVQRVVREAQNPSRKMFTDADDACRFLGEAHPDELARVEAFLDEAPLSGQPLSVRGSPTPPPARGGSASSSPPPSTRGVSASSPPPSMRGVSISTSTSSPTTSGPPSARGGSGSGPPSARGGRH